jgi:hypothetical protein
MAFTRWLRKGQFALYLNSKTENRRAAARSRLARFRPRLEFLEGRLYLSALPLAGGSTPADAATQSQVSAAYGQLPLSLLYFPKSLPWKTDN